MCLNPQATTAPNHFFSLVCPPTLWCNAKSLISLLQTSLYLFGPHKYWDLSFGYWLYSLNMNIHEIEGGKSLVYGNAINSRINPTLECKCICNAIDLSSARKGLPSESNTFNRLNEIRGWKSRMCSTMEAIHFQQPSTRNTTLYLCLNLDTNGSCTTKSMFKYTNTHFQQAVVIHHL